MDMNDDLSLDPKEFQRLVRAAYVFECMQCSPEFFDFGGEFLTVGLFRMVDVNKDGFIKPEEIDAFCYAMEP